MLTSYVVQLDNGVRYVTSMAEGVTLEQARKYFIGQDQEQPDGSTAKVCTVSPLIHEKRPMTFDEFIQSNKDAGKHYFDKDTMRFFASKLVHDSWNGDGYFITSEQFRGSTTTAPRRWSIRKGNLETFDVGSVGEFQAYSSLARARTALKELRQAALVDVK